LQRRKPGPKREKEVELVRQQKKRKRVSLSAVIFYERRLKKKAPSPTKNQKSKLSQPHSEKRKKGNFRLPSGALGKNQGVDPKGKQRGEKKNTFL